MLCMVDVAVGLVGTAVGVSVGRIRMGGIVAAGVGVAEGSGISKVSDLCSKADFVPNSK